MEQIEKTAKELLQERHRLEEAQMRDRAKERKMRTRRLIQRGAILEQAIPGAEKMTNEELQDYVYRRLRERE